jgi:hypothetical protein
MAQGARPDAQHGCSLPHRPPSDVAGDECRHRACGHVGASLPSGTDGGGDAAGDLARDLDEAVRCPSVAAQLRTDVEEIALDDAAPPAAVATPQPFLRPQESSP